MTELELKNMAKEFSEGVLGKHGSTDMCFAVCSPLATFLNFSGVECDITEGEISYDGGTWHHYWITLPDGKIIDPTADQFVTPQGNRLKNLWVENKPQDYRAI